MIIVENFPVPLRTRAGIFWTQPIQANGCNRNCPLWNQCREAIRSCNPIGCEWTELGDDGMVRVVSRAMQSDRDPDCAGVVVIYQNEIDAVIAALLEARSELGNDRNHHN